MAHQFPFTYWPSMLITFVLIVLPFFFLFPLFDLGWWGLLIFIAMILIGLIYGLRQALKWYYNVFVVTDKRVIDIDQRGLFDRTVSAVPYQNIEDVSYRIKGVGQTIFRYGNVMVDTASSSANLVVQKIRHPHVLQELISELRVEAREAGDERIQALKEFTEKLSIQEVKGLVKKLKKEERQEAVKEFFEEGDKD